MRKIVALIALMLLGVGIAKAAPNGVSVEVALDQDQFVPGEELVASVRVTNMSGRDLELGEDNQWLTFLIQGESGYVAPRPNRRSPKSLFCIRHRSERVG
jgi:hypothetical protein